MRNIPCLELLKTWCLIPLCNMWVLVATSRHRDLDQCIKKTEGPLLVRWRLFLLDNWMLKAYWASSRNFTDFTATPSFIFQARETYILNYLAYFSKTGLYNSCVATNKRQLSSWMQEKQPARKSSEPLQAFKKVFHFLMIKAFLMQTIHCLLKTREAGGFGKGQSNVEDKLLCFYH